MGIPVALFNHLREIMMDKQLISWWADSTDSGLSSSNDKDNLVDLSQSLENLLTNISKEGLTKATAMSASDKVILSFSL